MSVPRESARSNSCILPHLSDISGAGVGAGARGRATSRLCPYGVARGMTSMSLARPETTRPAMDKSDPAEIISRVATLRTWSNTPRLSDRPVDLEQGDALKRRVAISFNDDVYKLMRKGKQNRICVGARGKRQASRCPVVSLEEPLGCGIRVWNLQSS